MSNFWAVFENNSSQFLKTGVAKEFDELSRNGVFELVPPVQASAVVPKKTQAHTARIGQDTSLKVRWKIHKYKILFLLFILHEQTFLQVFTLFKVSVEK